MGPKFIFDRNRHVVIFDNPGIEPSVILDEVNE